MRGLSFIIHSDKAIGWTPFSLSFLLLLFSLFSLIMQKEAQKEDKLVLHYHDVVIRQTVSFNHLEA